ncbi:MAG: NAD(P)-dependent alcohol dehydrogenase [Sandaracinaceae bacterium]
MHRAWFVDGGFGLDELTLREREAKEPGPHDVRLRMRAWSLNQRDYMVVTGAYNPRQPLPLVPLSDGVGIVEAVGAEVRRVAVGDRVCPIFAQRWIDGPVTKDALKSTLGSPNDGVAAETVVLSEEGVVKVPVHLTDREAATLPCAALTAWSALFEVGRLLPGQTVLVQGTGGVSTFALQLATAAGARVIATSSKEDKLERAMQLGAWRSLRYDTDPRWGSAARELTEDGVDHVVEVGGAGTIAQSLAAVRPGGTISVIGVLGGVATEIALTRVLMTQVRVQGVFVGSRGNFERMNASLVSTGVRPVVDRCFAFEELPKALEYLKSGRHFGKVVLER